MANTRVSAEFTHDEQTNKQKSTKRPSNTTTVIFTSAIDNNMEEAATTVARLPLPNVCNTYLECHHPTIMSKNFFIDSSDTLAVRPSVIRCIDKVDINVAGSYSSTLN